MSENAEKASESAAEAEEAQNAQKTPPTRLYRALLKVQGKMPAVRKNGENPHYRSKYATLDELWETARKPLQDAGLAVYCTIENGGLVTHVVEAESGEEISCSFPLPAGLGGGDPQKVGSAMTYARRYGLAALLEIVSSGEDDDGEAAAKSAAESKRHPNAAKVAEAMGF